MTRLRRKGQPLAAFRRIRESPSRQDRRHGDLHGGDRHGDLATREGETKAASRLLKDGVLGFSIAQEGYFMYFFVF